MSLQFNTGLVIAGAYADKVRRTLFAQLKDYVRKGEVTSQEVAKAIGELNMILYNIIVEEMKLDKGDVVRITLQYGIENGQIKWNYSSLRIEVFKKIPDENVQEAISKSLRKVNELVKV